MKLEDEIIFPETGTMQDLTQIGLSDGKSKRTPEAIRTPDLRIRSLSIRFIKFYNYCSYEKAGTWVSCHSVSGKCIFAVFTGVLTRSGKCSSSKRISNRE